MLVCNIKLNSSFYNGSTSIKTSYLFQNIPMGKIQLIYTSWNNASIVLCDHIKHHHVCMYVCACVCVCLSSVFVWVCVCVCMWVCVCLSSVCVWVCVCVCMWVCVWVCECVCVCMCIQMKECIKGLIEHSVWSKAECHISLDYPLSVVFRINTTNWWFKCFIKGSSQVLWMLQLLHQPWPADLPIN